VSRGAADGVRLGREIKAARIGYSQEMSGPNSRWSWLDLAHRVIVPGKSGDCSSIVLGLYVLAGYPVDISGLCYTGNAAALTRAAGFSVTRFSGRLSDLRPGDALVEPGRHIVLILDGGECLSPETNELGRATGGRAGDQTGREVRIRPVYLRDASRADGGWTYLLRPPAEVADTLSTVITTAPATASVPAWPLPAGYYFGPKSGPRESVSGYFSHGDDLRRWQQRVIDRGWTSLKASGVWDAATARVVAAFQRQKLGGTGRFGPKTWAAAWTAPIT